MRRHAFSAVICLVAGLASGCAMCASPHEYDYGFYGGSWQRHDPCRGRVGSAFEPAGSPVMSTVVAEPIEAPRKPTPSERGPAEEQPEEVTPDSSSPEATEPISPRPQATTLNRGK